MSWIVTIHRTGQTFETFDPELVRKIDRTSRKRSEPEGLHPRPRKPAPFERGITSADRMAGRNWPRKGREKVKMTPYEKNMARRERMKEIINTMLAAENTRCACGCTGSWEHTVHGTSGPGREPCVWAGCPNCSGSAVGVPVGAQDLRWLRSQDEATVAAVRTEVNVRRLADLHGAGYDSAGQPCTLGAPRQSHGGRWHVPVLGQFGEVGYLSIDVANEEVKEVAYV